MNAQRPGAGAIAIAAFFALFPAAVAGGAMALAAIQGAAGLAATPLKRLRQPRALLTWGAIAALLLFVGYAAASSAWSVNPDHGQALRLVGGVLCGLLFVAGAGASEANRRLVRGAGVAAIVVTTVLLMIEAFGGMPLNHLAQPGVADGLLQRNPARGASALVPLIFPVVAALASGKHLQRMAWRALLIGVGIIAFQFDQQANTMAFGVGLAAYVAGLAAPQFALIALTTALAVWLVGAPWIILHAPLPPELMAKLPDSWAVRTEIWHFAATQAAAHPVTGLGLDAARTFQDTADLRNLHFSLIPLHPHDASLQIWLETGAIGAGLGALALILGGVALARALRFDRVAAAGACGAMASIGLIANVSYGAWQEWWIATAFAAAALVTASQHIFRDDGQDA